MTRRCKTFSAVPRSLAYLAILSVPGPALAQLDPAALTELDPAALNALAPNEAAAVVLSEMLARDNARKADVDQYAVRNRSPLSMLGLAYLGPADPSSLLLKEKVYCTDPATGEQIFTWRTPEPREVKARLDAADPNGLNATSGQLRTATIQLLGETETLNEQLEAGGVPVGLMSAIGAPLGDQIGVNILNPEEVVGTYALFFMAAADAMDLANSPDRGAAACGAAGGQMAFNDQASYAGPETVDGRDALKVQAPVPAIAQPGGDDMEVTCDRASMLVDAQYAVPLVTTIECMATRDGESRPMTIERRELDYRNVPGSNMYESYRQVLSMGGMMELGPEAEEAQRQMAELEQQLASMPEGQRAMMQRMMGSQLQTMRQMASGGGFEYEVIVDEIIVNPGVPGGPTDTGVLGAASPALLPYYVDAEGVGVLRYSDPNGGTAEYFLDIKRVAGQVLASGMGPYGGPDIGVYFGSLNAMGVPFDQLELELYQRNPRRTAARFRPEVDAERAEGMDDCGTVSSTGACSN